MSELKPEMDMTEAEIDAELRGYGIDPDQLMNNLFHAICVAVKKQSKRIADLEDLRDELVAALERTSNALRLAYSQKPLRDIGETLAEATVALTRAQAVKEGK